MAPITWEELSEESRAVVLLTPGTRLYGYCNGYFGRDSYGDKTVLASGVSNEKVWVVAEDEYVGVVLATDFNPDRVIEWLQQEDEEEEEGYGSPFY